MATRKKKTSITESADLAEMFDKKIIAVAHQWPKIDMGSHLTVYTYEDGTSHLEWDDEALEHDVREATKGK
jgi:hypothetical protein